ncbi:transmembrane sensory transduction histidine kinase for metal resistance [Thermomicrobium sp.]
MTFGLVEMQVVALIGLLAIASLAAWSSAALWQRQRKLEELVRELAASLGKRSGDDGLAPDADDGEGHLPDLTDLVASLKAADRHTVEDLLRTPVDLPRAAAIEVDRPTEPAPRFGFPSRSHPQGWEA